MHSVESRFWTKIDLGNAAAAFEEAAKVDYPMPEFLGNGIVIAAGGTYFPGAYVVVRLLRNFNVTIPIEIWYAGDEDKPFWAVEAFRPWNVEFRDIMQSCPNRHLKQMRGWAIKPAAILHSKFRYVLFIDADCLPVRNLEFLFDTAEFKKFKAVFWPDFKFFCLGKNSQIWKLTNLQYRGDREFESGIMLLDKYACWRNLCLADWMGIHSDFWYRFTLGDKNTFYLAWRKLKQPYFLAPACRRYPMVMIRHYWNDGEPIVDHRAGTSRYTFPFKKYLIDCYLSPSKLRPQIKNIYDELFQRFFMSNFPFHVRCLKELNKIVDNLNEDK